MGPLSKQRMKGSDGLNISHDRQGNDNYGKCKYYVAVPFNEISALSHWHGAGESQIPT